MTSVDQQTFDVVRRGYDIDQVDQFLIIQARAWSAELDAARDRVAELEQEVQGIGRLEAELDEARRQQEALTLTLQTAAQARDEMLAKTEQEIADLQASNDAALTSLRSEAEEQATALVSEARNAASEIEQETQVRSLELHREQEDDFARRRAELEQQHIDATQRYAEAAKALKAKVEDLNSMREALVAGLEAIAGGGLSAMRGSEELLASVGIEINTTNADIEARFDGSSNGEEPATDKAKTEASEPLDKASQEPVVESDDDVEGQDADSNANLEPDTDADADPDAGSIEGIDDADQDLDEDHSSNGQNVAGDPVPLLELDAATTSELDDPTPQANAHHPED